MQKQIIARYLVENMSTLAYNSEKLILSGSLITTAERDSGPPFECWFTVGNPVITGGLLEQSLKTLQDQRRRPHTELLQLFVPF